MKTLRIILACFFFLLVVGGLWRYFMSSGDIANNGSTFPLLSKITSLVDRSSDKEDAKGDEDQPTDDDDDLPSKDDEVDPSDDNDTEFSDAGLHSDFIVGELSPEELPELMQGGHLIGPNKAEILVIQYCDYNNIYCKQANDDGTLAVYMNKYANNVQVLIKQFPAKMDEDSLLPHRAALCALDRGTIKEYLSYEQLLYIQPAAGSEQLTKLAKDIGIDDFEECLDETNTTLYLQQEVKSAKKIFGLKSLPTYIFLNKDSGEWVMIPGLYENEEVLPVLDYLMKK